MAYANNIPSVEDYIYCDASRTESNPEPVPSTDVLPAAIPPSSNAGDGIADAIQ